MSEELTDSIEEEAKQGMDTSKEPLTPQADIDLQHEIDILEKSLPKTDADKYEKKQKQDKIFDEGADDIREVDEKDLDKYGI